MLSSTNPMRGMMPPLDREFMMLVPYSLVSSLRVTRRGTTLPKAATLPFGAAGGRGDPGPAAAAARRRPPADGGEPTAVEDRPPPLESAPLAEVDGLEDEGLPPELELTTLFAVSACGAARKR